MADPSIIKEWLERADEDFGFAESNLTGGSEFYGQICLYFLNYVTASIFVLILVPSVILRIAVEERTLFRIEGYRRFAESRKRLFPAVW